MRTRFLYRVHMPGQPVRWILSPSIAYLRRRGVIEDRHRGGCEQRRQVVRMATYTESALHRLTAETP
jgi:hypothetical protein